MRVSWRAKAGASYPVERAIELLRSGDYAAGIRLLRLVGQGQGGGSHSLAALPVCRSAGAWTAAATSKPSKSWCDLHAFNDADDELWRR
jgi:hypothetical protein